MKFLPMERWGSRQLRTAAIAAALALAALSAIATTAAAAPQTATDWFIGKAVIPQGQTSPVQINPLDISVRPDGAFAIGYTYEATGNANGQLGGSFSYTEHGQLFFKDLRDPSSMVGSRFMSAVFSLTPSNGSAPIQIADTSPESYKSGIATVDDNLSGHVRKQLSGLFPATGPLTYCYFTFTNPCGTYTGYATPDFTKFVIRITFGVQ